MSRINPKVELILFLSAFFAVWTLRAVWFIRFDQSIHSSGTRVVFSTLVKVLLWVIPAMLFAHWVRRQNSLGYLGLSAMPDVKTWMKSCLAIAAFCSVILSFEILVGQKSFSFGPRTAGDFLVNFSFFMVSPFVEEIFFRGLVLNELSKSMRLVFSNLIASFLFVGIHFPYWISSGTGSREIASLSVGVFIFSLFAGWLYSFSKSVWPPTAAHMANNLLSAMIVAR